MLERQRLPLEDDRRAHRAATKVQAQYRGYVTRKNVKEKRRRVRLEYIRNPHLQYSPAILMQVTSSVLQEGKQLGGSFANPPLGLNQKRAGNALSEV